MNVSSLRKLLLFALDELSARNGQYEFELLCQEVARARIASNIVTATGPVNAAGDQGRDGETYATSLHRELGPHSPFLARVSDEPVVLCMTIQKDGIDSKFMADAVKVTGSGQAVARIYAFCTVRVAVGTRHKSETAIEDEVGLPTTILDGNWLVEQLADDDLFWIAERYLDLPGEARPVRSPERDDDLPAAYKDARARWRSRELPPVSGGDFHDLRRALRFAAEPGPGRPDLPFWLDQMSRMREAEDESLRLRVLYELVVAHILGLRNLVPADDYLVDFLTATQSSDHPFRLQDAQVLLWFSVGMIRTGNSEISACTWRAFRDQITHQVESLLETSQPPTRRAYLWWTLGMLRICPKLDDEDVSAKPLEMPEIDVIRNALSDRGLDDAGAPLTDPAGAVEAWAQALEDIGGNNLMPIEPVADVVSMLTPVLIDAPGWSSLTDQLDSALIKVSGREAAGRQAFARAGTLHAAGRVRLAVKELNTARVAWHTGDNLSDAAEILLALAHCYSDLHLLEASQQFALGAAFMAVAYDRDDMRDVIPRGLALAGQADFLAGRWLRALRLLLPAIAAQIETTEEGFDTAFGDADGIAPIVQVSTIVRAARDLVPSASASIRETFISAGAEDLLDTLLSHPTLARAEWEKALPPQLQGAPFCDISPEHKFCFSALGIEWAISTSNNDDESLTASARFAAAAQALSVALAETDLCLIPGRIELRITTGPQVQCDTSSGHLCLSEWTSDAELSSLTLEAVAAAAAVLCERSLLPHEEINKLVSPLMTGSVQNDAFAGRDYDELFNESSIATAAPAGLSCEPLWDEQPSRQHVDLRWLDGPGPTYSRSRAEELLTKRYDAFAELLRGSLRQLPSLPSFRACVTDLREAGWLDWQILQGIHSCLRPVPDDYESLSAAEIEKYLMAPEPDEVPPIDGTLVTREMIDGGRKAGVAATVTAWGLELHTSSFELSDLERLMAARYNYWEDDIAHEDPFTLTGRSTQQS